MPQLKNLLTNIIMAEQNLTAKTLQDVYSLLLFQTAGAMLDGDPEVLLDAFVYYLRHNPDRLVEIAEFYG